jgi:fluoride ion exporter CrcB/FEX
MGGLSVHGPPLWVADTILRSKVYFKYPCFLLSGTVAVLVGPVAVGWLWLPCPLSTGRALVKRLVTLGVCGKITTFFSFCVGVHYTPYKALHVCMGVLKFE